MKTFELNGYTIAVPEIPDGANGVRLSKPSITTGTQIAFWWDGKQNWSFEGLNFIDLPKGNWQLYQLSELPEELDREIVKSRLNEKPPFIWHHNYVKPRRGVLYTSHKTFTSFLRFNGVENNPYLLIKKN